MRHNHLLQSVKSGGSLARNARFGGSKSQAGRSFSRFACQAQYFGSVSNASVSFSRGRRSTLQCGVSHLRGRRSILWRVQNAFSHCQGCANMTQWHKSWQAQHFVTALKSCGSRAKIVLLEVCENSFIRKTRIKSSILSFKRVKIRGSLARNARFGASKSQSGRTFSRFAWQAQHFRGMSISACRFRVAGAALSAHSFCICVAGAAFCDVAKAESKVVAGTAFGDVFEKLRKHRKSHIFSPV